MQNSLEGMFDLKASNSSVKVGNGDPLEVKMVGKWWEGISQKDDKKSKVTLEQVKYAPKLYANLFSVTQVLLQIRNSEMTS